MQFSVPSILFPNSLHSCPFCNMYSCVQTTVAHCKKIHPFQLKNLSFVAALKLSYINLKAQVISTEMGSNEGTKLYLSRFFWYLYFTSLFILLTTFYFYSTFTFLHKYLYFLFFTFSNQARYFSFDGPPFDNKSIIS